MNPELEIRPAAALPWSTMTPKQRITIAMRGGRPDRVPVTLGASDPVGQSYPMR